MPMNVAFALLLAFSVPAQAASARLAPAVVAKARAMDAECRSRGGQVHGAAKAVAHIDVNRDGRPDYVFDENAIVCGGARIAAPSARANVEVFITDEAGDAHSVFRQPARGFSAERSAAGYVVKLRLDGIACGAKTGGSLSACERALVWNEATRSLALGPQEAVVSTKPGPAGPPPAVAMAVKALHQECRQVGGKPACGELVQAVDLNGDGLDDYLLAVGDFQCEGALSAFGGSGGSPLSVYVGDGKGDASIAWEGYVFGHTVDRSGKAPVLYLEVGGPLCGDMKPKSRADAQYCQRPLQWSAAKRRFDYAPLSAKRPIPSR